jgi:FkbM family methyltransferase
MLTILTGIYKYIISSPSNKGQKIYRLILAFLWQIYKRIVGLPLISKLDNGKLFILYPQSTNSTANIYVRTYESEYIFFLRKFLPGKGIMLDIGSHMGIYSLLLADKFKTALCLEPAEDNFNALQNNLYLNRLSEFYPIKAAASNINGLMNFLTKGAFSGINTITDMEEGVKVQTFTIDYLIDHHKLDCSEITFVKIDTEGHEYNVLQGMSVLLSRNKSLLILTENSSYVEMKCLYEAYGFKMFAIDKRGNIITIDNVIANSYNYFAVGPLNAIFKDLP